MSPTHVRLLACRVLQHVERMAQRVGPFYIPGIWSQPAHYLSHRFSPLPAKPVDRAAIVIANGVVLECVAVTETAWDLV